MEEVLYDTLLAEISWRELVNDTEKQKNSSFIKRIFLGFMNARKNNLNMENLDIISSEVDNIIRGGVLDLNELRAETLKMADFSKKISLNDNEAVTLTYINMAVEHYLNYLFYCKENTNEDEFTNIELIVKNRINFLLGVLNILIVGHIATVGGEAVVRFDKEGRRVLEVGNLSPFNEVESAMKVNNNNICDIADSLEYGLDLEQVKNNFNAQSMVEQTNEGFRL